MISYSYVAKHVVTGETIKAQVKAENTQAAAKLLIAQQLFPISIDNSTGGWQSKLKLGTGVKSKDRVVFTRQLSTLINAGLPLVQALRTVQGQVSNKVLKDILDGVITSVEGGGTLASSFALYPNIFNQVYVSLVAAGESSGTLDKTLDRLAAQQEKDALILKKVRGALIYPMIVLIVIVLAVAFMLVTILPQVGQLYKDLGKELPVLTRALLSASKFVQNFWWLAIIVTALGVLGLRNFFKTERGKQLSDKAKMQMPLLGRLFKKVYMARFARTLGTLMSTGVPVLQAMAVVKEAVNNTLVAETIGKSIEQVKSGKALSETLEGKPTFLPLVPQMIRIGEQSGSIDAMLDKVATFYETEVDDEVKNLTTTLEPLLTVVMGAIVALLIAAILVPVYGLIGSGGLSTLK